MTVGRRDPSEGNWIVGSYRSGLDFQSVPLFSIWYNNLPSSQQVSCYLSDIKALQLIDRDLVNPAITVGSKTITFPVTLTAGSYLELDSTGDCTQYDPSGAVVTSFKGSDAVPELVQGANQLSFNCEGCTAAAGTPTPRAIVTVMTYGDPI